MLPCFRRCCSFVVVLAVLFCGGSRAGASGPHWVAGVNYFAPSAKGSPVVWANGRVSYFLDQGALSSTVSNSQAAGMVASAAAVWSSVPTAAVSIAQGGSLSEDVSGANVTANTPAGTGATLPSDAQPSATAEPVAVIFDEDGSVINDIYGPGASDPGSCTLNGVYSTVDNLAAAGTIAHAVILINGLCASSTALDQLLEYELVRAFGRVLGLDWSQVNDAMWPSHPTTDGLTGWPIMHPVEQLCTGSNTNCMPNPLTLRLDDIAGLNRLYPVTAANAGSWSGKTQTASATVTVTGMISFRNGQGMQGVNVVLTPLNGTTPDLRYAVSAVSGAYYRVNAGNAVTGAVDAQGNAYGRFGTDAAAQEGAFVLSGVPLPPGASAAVYQLSLEAVNPAYTGANSVGPYTDNQVKPSGAVQTVVLGSLSAGSAVTQNFTMADSADGQQTDDGLEAAPNGAGGNGEWISKLVGYGHTGWFQFHARANRYFTVEASSLDESGLGSESKAAVLIGLWNGTDALGSAPAMATTVPFNGAAVGLATLAAQTDNDGEIRIAYADICGDGRPDFEYRARVLYADSVFPPRLTLNGGPIAIKGQGFRPGMTVSLNGTAAAVTSITPTEITAVAPSVSAATGTVLLAVQDPQTLATAEILDGLSYDAQGSDAVRIVTAPSGTNLSQGVPVPMTVQVVAGNGTTPAANVLVTFAVQSGTATLGCTASPCTAMTDQNGMATVTVAPATSQATTVAATLSNGATVMTEFDGGTPPQIAATNTLYLAIGAQSTWNPIAVVLNNGVAVSGSAIHWTGGPGAQIQTAATTTNAAGDASTTVLAGPLAAGATATVYACEAGGPCATFTINAVHTELASLLPVSGVGQSLPATGTAMPVTLEVVDGSGHPLAGAEVNFYQQLDAWQPPCPAQGRCPAPRQLASPATSSAISDANGLVPFTPMSNNGQPAVLHVQATTGQQGLLQFTITQHP